METEEKKNKRKDSIRLTAHNDYKNTVGGIEMPLKGMRWEDFDVGKYIAKTKLKPGEDEYGRNKFNQKASDETSMDRGVPDTRHFK